MINRLIALIMTLVAIFFAADAKTYVVAAGIADYPGTNKDLKLCARDAETINGLFKLNSGASTILLTNSQATKSNIISAMNRLYAMAGPDDKVLLFFSGHGYRGGFVAYDGRLSYSEVRAAMAKGRSKHKMIFADACYSGKIRDNKGNGNAEDASAKSADVILFLSSRGNEKSYERRGWKNGIFTTYLDQALRGYADTNRDRVITAKELFNYVSKNVNTQMKGKQHPVMWGKFSDNMPIMVW